MTPGNSSALPSRVPLRGPAWFRYYQLTLYFCAIPVFTLFLVARDDPRRLVHDTTMWAFLAGCAVAAVLTAVLRRRRLSLAIYETLDNADQNYLRIQAVMLQNGWSVTSQEPGVSISASVPAKWTDLTWGDLVTVYFSGRSIAVNSMGDPNAGPSGSATWKKRTDAEIREILGALRVI